MNAITGVILAGGKSSRMGFDKGLAILNGKPMIQYVIDVFEKLGLDIIIISNSPGYETFGYPIYNDLIPEKGPVGGIYTALSRSTTDLNLIVSCDTPFLTLEVLKKLISQCVSNEITIAKFEGVEHPLIGIYSKKVRDVFKKKIDENKLKLKAICSELEAKIVPFSLGSHGVDDYTFNNINTQEQLNSKGL